MLVRPRDVNLETQKAKSLFVQLTSACLLPSVALSGPYEVNREASGPCFLFHFHESRVGHLKMVAAKPELQTQSLAGPGILVLHPLHQRPPNFL